MKSNAFTLPFTIFIALITIAIVSGSASIFKTQVQYEKMIQNYYLASTELNLAFMQAQKTSNFTEEYGTSKIKCESVKSSPTECKCQIVLKNGYELSKIIFLEKNNEP
ncbi:competence protein ComG [Listeria seeligeri]|uniref:competence protein ComG n=1 Tax=Listeria seeligeri TaxID=1640 RepID=UPI0018888885|nr:competence protein ComG [Listeria seeligeri]MBF2563757.1 competence protein ComG [Listeria seeligeri]